MSQLSIVVDENIPAAESAFGRLGQVTLRPGRELSRADLKAADVLIVRSVTPVTATLLEGTPVRFVGSATIGTDHVDRDYLQRADIQFANAPGCNANSVGDFVISALLELALQRNESLLGKSIGIVGAGNTGQAVARRCAALGMRVRLCDPPLAAVGQLVGAVAFEEILQCDIVSLHVPLVRTGQYPTLHLIDQPELRQLGEGAYLVNACRGEVINNASLALMLSQRADLAVALDVWEGEPSIEPSLAARVALATPHVAGYSLDGKLAGTRQILTALQQWLDGGHEQPPSLSLSVAPLRLDFSAAPLNAVAESSELQSLTAERQALAILRQVYDIRTDDRALRATLTDTPARALAFDRLRKNYPVRREFSEVEVMGLPPAMSVQARTLLKCLGVNLI